MPLVAQHVTAQHDTCKAQIAHNNPVDVEGRETGHKCLFQVVVLYNQ